jgi:hypothetical protein
MAKAKWIDERTYSLVKMLVDNSVPVDTIEKHTGLSYPTIKKIAKSGDFEDYKSPKTDVEKPHTDLVDILLNLISVMEDMNEKIDLLLAK